MSDLLPCPFCGEAIRHAHYGLIHPERDGECVLAGMTWDAEHYAAAWNTRVASHPATSTPVVSHKQPETSDNDLVERVARASAGIKEGGGNATGK